MPCRLAPLLQSTLDGRFKGYPQDAPPLTVEEAGRRGWRLLQGELGLPTLVIRREAMDHNRAFMRGFLARYGAAFCPHGKTTMAPQLFQRQMEDGAWGITVATAQQARVALEHGFCRLILASEVVHQAELTWIQSVHDRDPEAEIRLLVDSPEGLARLHAVPGARPFPVLLELGLVGARAGVRDLDTALTLARGIAGGARTELAGVECFEALGGTVEKVDAFLLALKALAQQVRAEGLLAPGEAWITAGGSAFFDRVGEQLRDLGAPYRLVMRSGCYLTHDAGLYGGFMRDLELRTGLKDTLRPALELWAQVISQPEPGLAILNAGKRDLPFDAGLPVPSGWASVGATTVTPVVGWKLGALYDQHVQLLTGEDAAPEVGTLVSLALSHPCTAFDKWPLVWLVDEQLRAVEAIRTCF